MPPQFQVKKSSPPILFLKETKKRRTYYGQSQGTDAKAIRETQA
jgi:hypothetical protein